MNEEALNMSLRKFLKVVGVTSQQEIEKAIRAAVADGRLKGNEDRRSADGAHHRQGRPQSQGRRRHRAGMSRYADASAPALRRPKAASISRRTFTAASLGS